MMTTPILVGCKDWDFNLHYRRALCSMKSDSVNRLRFHVQSTNLWFEGFLSESSARGCEQLQERHRSHFAVCHGCRLPHQGFLLVNRPSQNLEEFTWSSGLLMSFQLVKLFAASLFCKILLPWLRTWVHLCNKHCAHTPEKKG